MAWQDRIREAAYTSPSGTRITFDWESFERRIPKRTASFSFPDVNESYIQDSGYSSRQYPMRCIFHGDDYDLNATAFESALVERGTGRLEHPLYGTFDVIPFGEISRRDDLVNGANQAIVQVTFWTTILAIYPQSQISGASEISAAIGDYTDIDASGLNASAARHFQDATNLTTTIATENSKATIRSFLVTVDGQLNSIASATRTIQNGFTDAKNAIDFGLDVLIDSPIDLAMNVMELLSLPAQAAAFIQDRISAYVDLLDDIFGSSAGSPGDSIVGDATLPRRGNIIANNFHIADLFATATLAGTIIAATETEFETRTQAIETASSIIDRFDEWVAWREAGYSDLEQVDSGESYQAAHTVVSLMTGYLVETSFTLAAERSLVLDRARTIIDLVAQLYGSVDDQLDFLISTNKLTGSEILELPRGKKIVYYS